MKPDFILKADILDIIFEKRNKDYGAYPLRKYYNERLLKATGISFSIIAIACTFSILKKNKIAFSTFTYEDPSYATPPRAADQQKQDLSKQRPHKPIVSSTVPLQKPEILKDNSGAIVFKDESDNIKDVDPAQEDPGIAYNQPSTNAGVSGSIGIDGKDPAKPSVNNMIPVYAAEVMPSYPGGIKALREYLEKNLSRDIETNETVMVKIRFIVGYDGALKGYEIMEDGGEIFNNEVIRVLKKMPHWIPGKSNGENVSVFYTIPVIFTPRD